MNTNNGNFDPNLIFEVCTDLKMNGAYLDESSLKDQLDLYFNSLRNLTRDSRLDTLSRSRLLEVIELRAMGWLSTDELTSYHYQRNLIELESVASSFNLNSTLSQLDLNAVSFRSDSPTSLPALSATDFIRPSGKYNKPSKVAGKSFVKDEFVIRNCDSGKGN